MAEKQQGEKVTPMMRQYLDIKADHMDKVLFFRLGDFYEMFMEDAQEVSRLLNLTLTQRGGVPMCGIPYHAARNYIKRLLDAGKKIAICEQIELPENTKQLARRDVVQIITPATVIDDDFLDSYSNNYIVSVQCEPAVVNVSYCDMSTGEFILKQIPSNARYVALRALLEQLHPSEILVDEDAYFTQQEYAKALDEAGAMVTKLPVWFFSVSDGFDLLCKQAGTASLKSFGIDDSHPLLAPAASLIRYLKDAARTDLGQITSFHIMDDSLSLQIDEASRKNLEILSNLQDGSSHCTLFEAIDRTRTASGTRLLKKWLSFPLADLSSILKRQEWVTWFISERSELARVRQVLSGTLDMLRLTTRISMNRAMPHDLVAIKHTASSFFNLVSEHFDRYSKALDEHLTSSQLEEIVGLVHAIEEAVNEQCMGPFVEGQVILDGFDEQLDSLRSIRDHGSQLLNEYLAKVKAESGITTLRLSYNKIIGHFLEVSKGQVDKVPSTFYRKQTLVNAERFTTDELIECETKILRAAADAERRERALYETMLERTASLVDSLVAIGVFLGEIDCYQGLATVAVESSYVCPQFVDEDILCIEDGRHPVVERQLKPGAFVANGLDLGIITDRCCLITGPNMAGKSTYLRQNALIVLLAQIGSYVPASKATLGLVDKLFCRVGASDNLARGESTFLVEMQEAAYILRSATSRSLVIMDEIGRGTSTQDGMSIAYAMLRRLISMRPKTLFATHYHELTMLDTTGVQLLTLEVSEHRNTVVFLRKIKKGVANSSYGLHVAKLAGVPSDVVKEAATFQKQHFADYSLGASDLQLDLFLGGDDTVSCDSDSPDYDEIIQRLRTIAIDEMTPMQALTLLQQLQVEVNGLD